MQSIHYNLSRLTPLLLLLLLAGCDLFGSDDPQSGTLTLNFEHIVNGQDLTMNQQQYTSTAGHTFSITLLEYLLTDIELHDANGNVTRLANAHYLNEDDAATHALGAVDVPPGQYTSIRFTFGVPAARNVFGNLERSTDYDNMMWPMMMPMGDGTTERYHYMRFEGRYGTDGTFRIHTGPSGGNDYSFEVTVPLDIDMDGQDWKIGVAMNLDQWLTNPTDWNFEDYGMIMGNQTAQSLIYDNGHSVFGLGFANVE